MKRKLFIGALGTMMFLLCACGKEEDVGIVEVEKEKIPSASISTDVQENQTASAVDSSDAEKAENPEANPSQQGEELPVSDGSLDRYYKIYSQIVEKKEGNTSVFSLIYLDGDDIPELVVCDRDYGTYSVYTVRDDDAFCMVDSMNTVEMDYFERSGVIAQFERWNGGGDEGGYGWYYYQVSGNRTLVDGDTAALHYRCDAVYDDEGNRTGGTTTKYYHMGQETDEKTYRQKMNDLGIVEGNEKLCADNAPGKEEMLAFLNQSGAAGTGGGSA